MLQAKKHPLISPLFEMSIFDTDALGMLYISIFLAAYLEQLIFVDSEGR